MTTLPTFSTYGNYSSDNYGAHAMKINMGVFELYYSYQTIVAFYDPEFGLVVSKNIWGVTTGKHLNAIDSNKKSRLERQDFEKLLKLMLDSRLNNHVVEA